MDLVNARIVTDDVITLARFYGALLDVDVATNDYYAEVPTRVATVAICKRRFGEPDAAGSRVPSVDPNKVIIEFAVVDVDVEYGRVKRLDVEWIMVPTTQPWGNRSMMFRDPDGNVVNVFAPTKNST
jgi:predicted enzyme related to lactoylglutathione lyase